MDGLPPEDTLAGKPEVAAPQDSDAQMARTNTAAALLGLLAVGLSVVLYYQVTELLDVRAQLSRAYMVRRGADEELSDGGNYKEAFVAYELGKTRCMLTWVV